MSKAALSLSSRALADLSRDVLDKGRSFQFTALGYSMHPFIQNGDILTISAASAERLAVGDVAAVVHPQSGNLVIHRVTGRTASAVTIRGDNVSAPDEPIPRTHVLGRVIRIERNGQRVSFGLGPERALLPRLNSLRHRPWFRPLLRVIRAVLKP